MPGVRLTVQLPFVDRGTCLVQDGTLGESVSEQVYEQAREPTGMPDGTDDALSQPPATAALVLVRFLLARLAEDDGFPGLSSDPVLLGTGRIVSLAELMRERTDATRQLAHRLLAAARQGPGDRADLAVAALAHLVQPYTTHPQFEPPWRIERPPETQPEPPADRRHRAGGISRTWDAR